MFRRKKKDQQQAPPEVVSPLPQAQWHNFVQAVYRGMLGRNPDSAGAHYCLSRLEQGMSATELIYEIMGSEEYESRHYGGGGPEDGLPELGLAVDYPQQSQQLASCTDINRARFDAAWAQLADFPAYQVIGQQDYCAQHRGRVRELVNAVAYATRGKRAPRILEIGVSAFSNIYHLLFPSAELDLLDRPTASDYAGFNAQRCRQIEGCRALHELDLNAAAALPNQLADGGYDLILFTETLSQLTVNPVELIGKLLGWLATDGFLYITTVNFFSAQYHQALIHGRNPAPYYPRGDGNWDAHHLHRDYSRSEILDCVYQAGGEITASYFTGSSGAFTGSSGANAEQVPAEQRKRIVCLARKAVHVGELVADEDREIILHIGSDKAGSTAIQLHTYGNRDWLVRHGVYVPASYLGKNNGHAGLFEHLDDKKLATLTDEISQKAGRFGSVFLSWEGAHFLTDKNLALLAKHLGKYRVRVIFYLREQADVIQSGILQNIKNQVLDVDLRKAASHTDMPETRDYYQTLKRWQNHFPGLASEVVFFDRQVFPEGNVVKDLLVRLGCDGYQGFVFYQHDINISLDVASALAAQRRFSSTKYSDDERRDFIDALLLCLKEHGSGQKYFLARSRVENIRAHYRGSNERLAAEFGINAALFEQRENIYVDGEDQFAASPDALVEQLMARAAELDRYPVCFGGFARDKEVVRYLGQGWTEADGGDFSSNAVVSTLNMRPFLQNIMPFHRHLNLRLLGRYQDNRETGAEVFINGESYGTLPVGHASFSIPMEELPATLALNVELRLVDDSAEPYLLEALRLVAT